MQQPDVSITTIGPSLIISPSNSPGAVPYRIVVTNVGNMTLTNIVITDTLPSGMSLFSQNGLSCNALPPGAICPINHLGAGATKVFTLNTTVDTPPACGATMLNQVVALSSEGDINMADNTAMSQAIFGCERLNLPLILR